MLDGSFAAHEWYADKPFFFRAYLDREMLKIALYLMGIADTKALSAA